MLEEVQQQREEWHHTQDKQEELLRREQLVDYNAESGWTGIMQHV